MISASTAYAFLSKDLSKSLDRVASQAPVKREEDYYKSKINKVKTLDDFMGDYRLYSYAMKAYGLEDMTYAKAFMKKVLESDLTDPASFANKLTDTRYKQFAAAFNFGTQSADAQSDAQEDELLGLYTQSFANEAKSAETETAYYDSAIDRVADVSDLIGDKRMMDYVLKAYGIDPTYITKDFLSQVLTSDVSDPDSFVNVNANAKYQALAKQFNFNADGSVNGAAQTADQKQAVEEQYNLTVPSITTADAADFNKAYYQKTIPTITSVDQLVADSRLTSYLKTAYGVAQDFATPALKLVLTSQSYAETLGYGALHAAFNFNSDGTIASGSAYAAQTPDQVTALVNAADSASTYYQAQVTKLTSVDQLIADPKLSAFLKSAYAVPSGMADSDVKRILTDAAYAGATGYSALHDAFNFQSDGSVPADLYAQTTSQARSTATRAADNLSYFQGQISSVADVDALLSDSRMNGVIRSVYSVPATVSDTDLKAVLTDSAAASARGLSALNAAFSFAGDGSAAATAGPQSNSQIADVSTAYMANYAKAQQQEIDDAVANYKKRMTDGKIKTVEDFLKSNAAADSNKSNDELPELYEMALRAYGLTRDEVSPSEFRKLLKSDPFDAKGYVASFKDDRITKMIRDFNFSADGKIAPEVTALPQAVLAKYATNYKSMVLLGIEDTALKTKTSKDATKAVDAFATGIAKVRSLDDLLADSKLTDFVLKANGLNPKSYDKEVLKKIFTSDPSDPKSYLNTKAPAIFKEIVSDFNFDKKGALTRDKIGAVQNIGAEDRTTQAYLQQTMETQEGESNDGVRLALYFSRKASSITSVYSLMADKALYQVIQTTFNLPSAVSSMDVEKQASMLKKFVTVTDFQDPAKVDKLVKRFTAMYDAANATGDTSVLQLFR